MCRMRSGLHVYQSLKQILNALNIIIEEKDSGERYVAENKCSPFKFVVGQSGKSAPNLHMSKG